VRGKWEVRRKVVKGTKANELYNNSQMLLRKRRQALEELVDDGVRRTWLLTWLVVVDG
jgi:hypothetical protein